MELLHFSGWIAAAFTLSAFSMKTMLPLRISALGASVFFIIYGLTMPAYPVLALHTLLLPFNAFRLIQILRLDRAAEHARTHGFSLDWVRKAMSVTHFSDGHYIFRKGDPPDAMYVISKGRVRLEEIGVELDEGEVFGEIAFFTAAHERTLSARCVGTCEILAIGASDFMRLYHQNPAFSIYIMRLVTERLMEGISQNPDAYRPVGRSEREAKSADH